MYNLINLYKAHKSRAWYRSQHCRSFSSHLSMIAFTKNNHHCDFHHHKWIVFVFDYCTKEPCSLLQHILFNDWFHCPRSMSLWFILRGCLLHRCGADPVGRQGLHIQRWEECLFLPEPCKAVGRELNFGWFSESSTRGCWGSWCPAHSVGGFDNAPQLPPDPQSPISLAWCLL